MASSLILAKAGIQSFIFSKRWLVTNRSSSSYASKSCLCSQSALLKTARARLKHAIVLASQDVNGRPFCHPSTGFPFPRE